MAYLNSISAGNITGANTIIAAAPNFDPSASSNNLIIGTSCGEAADTFINTTLLGCFAGETSSTSTDCVAVGYNAANALGTMSNATIIGSQAGQTGSFTTDSTYIGFQAGESDSGDFNVAIGSQALSGAGGADGGYNIAIGYLAGSDYTANGEYSNIVIGNIGTASDANVIRIGTDGTSDGEQDSCFIAGTVTAARNFNLPATTSTVGKYQIDSIDVLHTYGGPTAYNVFIGNSAGNYTLTGNEQFVAGAYAGNALTTGIANTLVGVSSGRLLELGDYNCIFGNTAFANSPAGSLNIVIGAFAGSAYIGGESDNILLSNAGEPGESGAIRIGSGVQTTCYIAGIDGVTTGGTGTPVLVDVAGQLGTISSSERFKEDIQSMGDLSARIYNLRPVTFHYKERRFMGKQFGLIAEEVLDEFPELVHFGRDGEAESVHYHILPSLLLNEVQKLRKMVEDLQKKCCKEKAE